MTIPGRARVAVCIPTFERAALLGGAIESALAQDYDDLVVVVSDNGSTDSTPEVVASFTDPRVHYERRDRNYGLVDNLNHVMTLVDSDFVVLVPDDDRLTPGCVERAVRALHDHPTAGFVHASFDTIDARDRVIDHGVSWNGRSEDALEPGSEFIRRALPVPCRVCVPTAVFRREVLTDPPMDPDFGIQHDIVLTLTIALDHDVMFLATPGARFRVHEEADSSGFGAQLSGGAYAFREDVILEIRDQRLRWIERRADRIPDPADLRRILRAGTVRLLLDASRAEQSRTGALGVLGRAIRDQPEALLRRDVWMRAAGILSGRRRTVLGAPEGA